MQEIIFIVEESEEGGFIAKALGISIFTEAETYDDLKAAVKDAVLCHFDDQEKRIIRLHYVKEKYLLHEENSQRYWGNRINKAACQC
jgi:hypothetical protein